MDKLFFPQNNSVMVGKAKGKHAKKRTADIDGKKGEGKAEI